MREYFQVSIDVAQNLGRRAIFLTPFQEQIPQPLPAGVRAFRFVPLEKLLPRSIAHVHHAGSGTVAHTLAAGIPHLTVPQGIDQVDIGRRLAQDGSVGQRATEGVPGRPRGSPIGRSVGVARRRG